MKYFLCLTFLITGNLWSKNIQNFNKTLNQEVKKEIIKDDQMYKKESRRGPASVEVEPRAPLKEPSKIDKNIRQIGPNRW